MIIPLSSCFDIFHSKTKTQIFLVKCNTTFDRTLSSLLKVINLKTQLSYFKNVEKLLRQKLGTKDAKQLLHNSVFLFSIGGNDYVSPIGSNSSFYHSFSQAEYVDMVIGNLTTVIKVVKYYQPQLSPSLLLVFHHHSFLSCSICYLLQEIYKDGGRKFGFVGSIPYGYLPAIRILITRNSSGESIEEVTNLANLHNKALARTLQKLQDRLKGFKYSNFHLYSSFMEFLDNPSNFGK